MSTFIHILEFVLVPVLVAVVTAAGAWWANRANDSRVNALSAENTEQHDHNAGLLMHLSRQVGNMDNKIDKVDERLDGLSVWALEHEKAHLVDGTLDA